MKRTIFAIVIAVVSNIPPAPPPAVELYPPVNVLPPDPAPVRT